MTQDTLPEPTGDQLRDEASSWFARMRGPEAEKHRPDFEKWLARGAVHLGAYNRIAEIFAMGTCLDEPQSVPITRGWSRPIAIALAAVLVLSVAIALAFFLFTPFLQQPRSVSPVAMIDKTAQAELVRLETGTAGRLFHLTDGSSVQLRPGSILTVAMTSGLRELRLEKGSGRFTVAHDGRRFIVKAGSGSVTALGTIFDVDLAPDSRVTVKLIRGLVEVAMPATGEPRPDAAPLVTRLHPGEMLAFTQMARPLFSPAPSPQLSGPMMFDAVPLENLVARSNAIARTRIRIVDRDVAKLTVSGRFRIDDGDALADRLAALFALDKVQSGTNEVTLSSDANGEAK